MNATEENKLNCPLISPAIYKSGTSRKITNVEYLSNWTALDFDDGIQIDEFFELARAYGLNFFLHTTTKHTEAHHKFRVIIPTDREIKVEEYWEFWHGTRALFGDLSDKACKDASRMYVIPVNWQYAETERHFIASQTSSDLCVDDMIAKAPPRPPEADTAADVSIIWEGNELTPYALSLIVTDKAVAEYQAATKGGRYFSFLCSVAAQAKYHNIVLGAADLHQIGLTMNRMGSNSERRYIREATRALQHVGSALGPDIIRKEPFKNFSAARKLKLIKKFT